MRNLSRCFTLLSALALILAAVPPPLSGDEMHTMNHDLTTAELYGVVTGSAAVVGTDTASMREHPYSQAPEALHAELMPAIPAMGVLALLTVMFALGAERDTPKRDGRLLAFPIGADVKIWAGGLTVIDGGYAVPGTEAPDLVAAGRANETVDNTDGAAGALTVEVERGVFRFENAGDITQEHVLLPAYVVDDETVSADDDSGGRSLAGLITAVDAAGVWVEIGVTGPQGPAGPEGPAGGG